MVAENEMKEELIAPCGMNCGVCSSYLALQHDFKSQGLRIPYCKGCRPRDKQCSFIKKRCEVLLNKQVESCHECKEFPCSLSVKLDKGYRERYRMSMIENLNCIRENGITALLQKEAEKWRCPECGGVICCHNGICFSCGLSALKAKKKLYRWEDE